MAGGKSDWWRRTAVVSSHFFGPPSHQIAVRDRPQEQLATKAVNIGRVLAGALAVKGVNVVFGVPGNGQYEATDALHGSQQEEDATVRYIVTRHEQACTYMADGFSRVATDSVGVALVLPGPGFYNAAVGLIPANSVHSKVLVGDRQRKTRQQT